MNDPRTAIWEIVRSYGKLSVDMDSVGDEDDLVELGLTSHATVNVMLALEDEFDFEFPDELLTKETFESIAAMLTVVSSLVPS